MANDDARVDATARRPRRKSAAAGGEAGRRRRSVDVDIDLVEGPVHDHFYPSPPIRDMPEVLQVSSGRTHRHRRHRSERRSAEYAYEDMETIAEEAPRPKRVSDDERRHRKEPRVIVREVVREVSSRNKSPPLADILKRTLSGRDARPKKHEGSTTSRPRSFLGFFAPAPKPPPRPVRMVECLTCMDSVPHRKSAKLKCGHRMCHACLRRIFRMSVNDPQHMPPKCCTADHIPLKHVDKLFDMQFKILWNRKFQEYTTANRIYCPSKKCGEWIRPANIHSEDGKKYGKCSRCKTKVCCLCNGKWHGRKDCPKDEETNALLEAAKQAGWQRCYNCRTMVELKEGCNHMTCHCTAEFCMLCGLKWKSCNCPWFNYETVEADRLNHMRVPGGYDDEIRARRRQERRDEDLARRMADIHVEEYLVGNAAPHHMNERYIRPAPMAQVAANVAMRQRAVPARPARPARHAPPRVVRPPPRAAVLAGLGGRNRVGAWRTYVEPGQPEEGVLSM